MKDRDHDRVGPMRNPPHLGELIRESMESEPSAVPECRDPFDRPFLELALVGQADALVTGDGDLLAVAPLFSVPILTPDELRGRVRA